jgi:RNA polymerase sigma-70 factor (ECF subfamily)
LNQQIETAAGDAERVAAARSGDERAFAALFERHHGAIRLHCYRMLGSMSEAEDITQDTFLRAWRGLDAFSGRASFRTWLYRIATNAALDALSHRKIRLLPLQVEAPADPSLRPSEARSDIAWLEPYPDQWLDELAGDDMDPVSILESREAIGLAFLSLVQAIPARQRAVLILREVLHWPASEVADLLQTSVPAVNSALQRARTALELSRRAEAASAPHSAEVQRTLARYISAWEAADTESLVALLKDDATFSMPPSPAWYRGRDAIRQFFEAHVFAPGGCHHGRAATRLLPTAANRQPALAVYDWDAGQQLYLPFAIKLLAIEGSRIAGIVAFTDPRVFAAFGLPASIARPASFHQTGSTPLADTVNEVAVRGAGAVARPITARATSSGARAASMPLMNSSGVMPRNLE